MIVMSSKAITHEGLVRDHNEDSMLVTERLVAVADGLGGHAAGEVASGIAVERMRELGDNHHLHPDDILDAIAETNAVILSSVKGNPERAGMGTTLCGVALVVYDGLEQCAVFNVGDSRAYRLVDGVFTQVSVDHSEVQELQDSGQITPEAAAVYPRRNIITRCLGTNPGPDPDLWTFVPSERERFVICSDGLSGEVADDAIAQTLAQVAEPGEAAQSLVQQALDGGGRDNVTVIVIDMLNDPDATGSYPTAASAVLDSTAPDGIAPDGIAPDAMAPDGTPAEGAALGEVPAERETTTS